MTQIQPQVAFIVDQRHHGSGTVLFSWSPGSRYLASTGPSKVIHIHTADGKVVDQVIPPASSPCVALAWDPQGTTLAIIQDHHSQLLLWHTETREMEHVHLKMKDPTFLKWSLDGKMVAIGTSRGSLFIYHNESAIYQPVGVKYKKAITCGDWNSDGKFAFASQDKQVSICNSDGSTYGKIKVSGIPSHISFGGNQPMRDNVVSVTLDHKTILLYDLDEPENAFELAFQEEYGRIVCFEWFGPGLLIVGFSRGCVIIISTLMEDIGQEQLSIRVHRDHMNVMAVSRDGRFLATANKEEVKIVDVRRWKEILVCSVDAHVGNIEHMCWTPDGNFLSIGTCIGNLIMYTTSQQLSLADSVRIPILKQLQLPITCSTYLVYVCMIVLAILSVLGLSYGISVKEILVALFRDIQL